MKLKQPALLKVCELTAEHTVKNFTDLQEHFLCLGVKVCYVRRLADFEDEGGENFPPGEKIFSRSAKNSTGWEMDVH
jgi:hypothetical protein